MSEVTRPDKLMFSSDGLTKEDVAEYYRKIADRILPYLKDRPLVMHRYPDGISGKDFYQKQIPDYFPDSIPRVSVELREEGQQEMVVCDSENSLVYLVNQGVLTPHVWLSSRDNLERPDFLIFDLDPPKDAEAGSNVFNLVKQAARLCKEMCDSMGIPAYLMTSGASGMHVRIPLDGNADFTDARDFARGIARLLVRENPELCTIESRISKRRGRIFIDYLRNAYGQTSVAPYALRARPGAPVAVPLSWDELGRGDLRSDSYHIGNIFQRLAQKTDPWQDITHRSCSISSASPGLQQRLAESEDTNNA